jgi:hypothetical protein
MKEALDFVDAAREEKGRECRVLVHCFAGINRSAAIAAAYVFLRGDCAGVGEEEEVEKGWREEEEVEEEGGRGGRPEGGKDAATAVVLPGSRLAGEAGQQLTPPNKAVAVRGHDGWPVRKLSMVEVVRAMWMKRPVILSNDSFRRQLADLGTADDDAMRFYML